MSVTSDVWVLGDRYEVGRVIGRGGMGEVRHARDRRLGRDVAIKFLRRDLAAQPAARQRFEDEARNAARLTHPNVVLVLDTGEHDGVPYLVMECLPGRTLRDELKEGQIPVARLTWIARDVLAGLAAAHEMGIVHRDVTPANILLTETGRAKLADFGIAKALDAPSVTMVGQVLGTPAYVAPERLLGEPATPAADVYGVGATLYHALAGTPPFKGDTPIAVAHKAVSSRPERLEHVRPDAPLDLVAAVDQAMDPDPQRRPTAEALAASLAGEETIGETSALPIVGDDALGPETVAEGAVGAGAAAASASPMATIAQPVVDTTTPRTPRTWRERGLLVATVLAVAIVGLILLAVTDHSSGRPATASTPTTAATAPTTAVTAPPTTTPVTAAHVVVRAPVQRAPKPGGHGGKKGKH